MIRFKPKPKATIANPESIVVPILWKYVIRQLAREILNDNLSKKYYHRILASSHAMAYMVNINQHYKHIQTHLYLALNLDVCQWIMRYFLVSTFVAAVRLNAAARLYVQSKHCHVARGFPG